MGSTLLFVAIMALLLRFSTMDKWWLWFVLIMGLLVRCGYEFGMIGLIGSVAIWKIVKDVCSRL